jgi:photosystem II stability/assembly factor-like uncharacterized protein
MLCLSRGLPVKDGSIFVIFSKLNLQPVKKSEFRLGYICGFLIIMQLLVFCKRDNYIISENEPHIDGWKLESISLELNVLTTKLYFINPSTGYIIGFNGKIFITTDSGRTWQALNSETTLHLNSIFFLDRNIGFISGRGMSNCLDSDCDKGSIFLRTTDGGLHWDKIFYDSLAFLESMQFKDPENGIAVMECNQRPNKKFKFLVKTTNAGTTWIKTGVNIPQEPPATLINSQDIYYLIGENNKILKSNDYGITWLSYSTPITASNDIQVMYFISRNVGFISDGTFRYKTTNGALSWQKIDNQPAWFSNVHFSNDQEGFGFDIISDYVGGDFPSFKGTYIYTTNNGGISWSRSNLYSDFIPGYQSFPNPTVGYSLHGSTLTRFIKK